MSLDSSTCGLHAAGSPLGSKTIIDPDRARPLSLLIVLQFACALGLGLGVATLLHTPLAALSDGEREVAALCAAGYLLCVGLLFWREYRGRRIGLGDLISALAIGYAPLLIFVSFSRLSPPRRVLLPALLVAAALAGITVLFRRVPALRGWVLAAAAAIGLLLPFSPINKPAPPASVRVWRLNSALYPLKVTEYLKLIGPSRITGGAVAPFRDRFLVATGGGEIYLVGKAGGGAALAAQRLPYQIPINSREFEAAVGQYVDATSFRTADLLAEDLGESIRVFATHHFWKAEQKCFVVRVSMLEGPVDRFLNGSLANLPWKTIFESSPCVSAYASSGLWHFAGIQVGGRLALLGPNQLLVAVGDHELDGVNAREAYPQDPGSSYGKTILINLADFSSQLFSLGHRNPQGLFADGDAIWLTEHGPQGGDELNRLERGSNYGWPLVTYGTQYGQHSWASMLVPGSHEGFAEPYYSWVPSIGVSSLLVVHGPQFKLWQRDLLISSLKDGAVYRARVRDARVVMMERIPFGRRIRDVAEGSDGQILLLTDKGALLNIEIDTEVGGGEALFHACSGCHAIGDGTNNGIGPDLRHVVGRPTASVVGARYSPALQQLGGKWTRPRLNQFLANPQAFAPGTAMRFPGMPDADQRKELIEFLASGTNNHPPPEQ
ncbi:MAG: PQQ-dependent sugar dehydrogenase [Steroidobacteraceae bacterium]